MKRTSRGFALYEFKDQNGHDCSLQKSSLATQDAIWLGADEIGVQRFTPGTGWTPVELRQDGFGGVTHIANNRMHLTREQVAELLPFLQRFVETGEIEE